jgi:hypothetical protein
MAIENQDFVLHQGTTLNLRFEVLAPDGSMLPLEDINNIWWGMIDIGGSEAAIVADYQMADGRIEYSESEPGIILVSISPETTFIEPGYYWHELRIQNGPNLFVASSGKVLVKPSLVSSFVDNRPV